MTLFFLLLFQFRVFLPMILGGNLPVTTTTTIATTTTTSSSTTTSTIPGNTPLIAQPDLIAGTIAVGASPDPVVIPFIGSGFGPGMIAHMSDFQGGYRPIKVQDANHCTLTLTKADIFDAAVNAESGALPLFTFGNYLQRGERQSEFWQLGFAQD